MHVYLLAGLPGTPSESSEHEERVAALDLHHHRVGVVSARFLRTPNARSILQRCKLFARGLQSALQVTCLVSAVPVAHAGSVPCDPGIWREASRAVRQFFRIV